MSAKPPKITTRTARVQPPPGPPIDYGPPAPLPVGAAPPADIQALGAGFLAGWAAAQVPAPPQVQLDLPIVQPKKTVLNWSPDYLFTGIPTRQGNKIAPPIADIFSLFVLSTMARLAYVDNFDAVAAVGEAIPGVAYERRNVTGDTRATYDVWSVDRHKAIFALPGTSELGVWASYVPPVTSPADFLATGLRVFSGILTQINRYRTHLMTAHADRWNGKFPTVWAGHSLGGAIGQAMLGMTNKQWVTDIHVMPAEVPSVANYTFGSPAWIVKDPDLNLPWLTDLSCRVFNPGDPIPRATQVVLGQIAGLITPVNVLFPTAELAPLTTTHYGFNSFQTLKLDKRSLDSVAGFARYAFLTGGPDLVNKLVDQHSIVNYCYLLEERCRDRADVPLGAFASLVKANRLLSVKNQ